MNGHEFEDSLDRLMKQDFSAGTEPFRDALLARCLSVLGSDGQAVPSTSDIAEIDDFNLELLAAAGDAAALESGPFLGDNGMSGKARKES